jgi:hypothetical protein
MTTPLNQQSELAHFPVLPPGLRAFWRGELIPTWVCDALGLESGSTFVELDGRMLGRTDQATADRIIQGLTARLSTRHASIAKVFAFPARMPTYLEIDDLGLSRRTRNALIRANISNGTALSQITIGELIAIRNFGVKSLIELTCAYELYVSSLSADSVKKLDKTDSLTGSELEEELNREAQNRDKLRLHEIEKFRSYMQSSLGNTWVDVISGQDPRFPAIRSLGNGTLEQLIEAELEIPEMDINTSSRLVETLQKVAVETKVIGNTDLLTAIADIVINIGKVSAHLSAPLIARLGLGGEPSITLQQAGDLANVSRERIRQVESRTLDRRPDHPIFMPQLRILITEVEKQLPLSVESASDIAVNIGVSKNSIHPASISAMAAFCGWDAPAWKLNNEFGHVRIESIDAVDSTPIVKIARSGADGSGAIEIARVVQLLSKEESRADSADVLDVISRNDHFEFLTGSWFWHAAGVRNRLVNQSKKMLAVTNGISVLEIHEGLSRVYQFRNSSSPSRFDLVVPPPNVLKAFFTAHTEFSLDEEGLVQDRSPIDYRTILGNTEVNIVDVLRSSPTGLLDRSSLVDECVRRGVNLNSLNLYTTYSIVLKHHGLDVWGLRGAVHSYESLAAIQDANSSKQRERRIVDHGWTDDGLIRVTVKLPRNAGAFVFGIPTGVKEFVSQGSFDAFDELGSPCGTIGVNELAMSYGYGSFLQRNEHSEGDLLIVEFNTIDRKVHLKLA